MSEAQKQNPKREKPPCTKQTQNRGHRTTTQAPPQHRATTTRPLHHITRPLCKNSRSTNTIKTMRDHRATTVQPLQLASRSDADKNEGRNEKGEKRREMRGVSNVKEMM